MELDGIEMLVVFFASIAIAGDRFVVIVKSLIPMLADPNDPVSVEYYAKSTAKPLLERTRRLWIHFISFIGGSLAAWAWTEEPFHWGSKIHLVLDKVPMQPLSPFVAGMFGVAGAAFWASVLGYVTAAKDIKKKVVIEQEIANPAPGRTR